MYDQNSYLIDIGLEKRLAKITEKFRSRYANDIVLLKEILMRLG